MQLTKLEWVKNHLSITTTPQDDQKIRSIILAVSEQIESYCNRFFEATTYKSWLNGTGAQDLLLPNWPVSNIYALSLNTTNAGSIYNSDAVHADVEIASTKLVLHSLSAAGVETETELLYSAYATLTLLSAAVNAVGGWTSTLIGNYGSYAPLLVKQVKSTPALYPERVWLEIPQSYEEVELQSGTDRAISLRNGGWFPCGVNNIFVWYKAGYTLPNDTGTNGNLPNGLTLIVNEIVGDLFYASRNNNSYKSESIGDHSWTLNDEMIKSAVSSRSGQLTPYRRIEL